MEHQDDPELRQLSQYDIRALMDLLARHRDAIGLDRVINIEWFFLPMLGFDAQPPTLHRQLGENPKFFVQLLTLIYRGEGEEKKDLGEQHRRAAENAYHLLHSWSRCPGVDENGNLDAEHLRNWVVNARRLLADAKRVAIGDQHIGQALAAAPTGSDGIWPHESVRELLEDLDSDEVDRGLEIRLFNNRGVHGRALDAGGKLEWDLANDYAARADALFSTWPHIASIYRSLAQTYEKDARREDAKAERRQRGLD